LTDDSFRVSMAFDPKDFILPSHLVDQNRFSGIINNAALQVSTSPYSGITVAVDAGAALRNILSPSVALLGSAVVPAAYPLSAYSSLATLTKPYEAMSALAVTNPYRVTADALAVAGSIGRGVHDLYANTSLSPSVLGSSPLSVAGAAFTVGVADSLRVTSSVTAPYLASSAAVFSLETSYAKLLGNTDITIAGAASINALQSNVLTVSGALRDAWNTMRTDSAFLSTASLSGLRSPAVELYTATQAAASISLAKEDRPATDEEVEDILDETVDAFESRLAAVHQGLVSPYRGGAEALANGGTDWQRHAMVSFRELSTHVLHHLAPDAEILPTAKPADLHNGKPTRRARLNFIFADVGGNALAKFYDADMKAALKLFDLLNDGTHRLEQDATPDQVHYLRGRIVGLLSSMLEARGF
jgi:Predicted pPIWI-associating nuclease